LVTGGDPKHLSLLTRKYNVARSALLIDIKLAIVEELPQMEVGRIYHSVAIVANHAYIIAGQDSSTFKPVASVERYDIQARKWVTLTSLKFD